MTKPKQNLVGCRVKIGDEFGTVRTYLPSPTYVIERDDGTTSYMRPFHVKRLSRDEEVEFWRQRALAAESVAPVQIQEVAINRPNYNNQVIGTDTGYTATCEMCGAKEDVPADAPSDAVTELDDNGWVIGPHSALCQKCSQ